MNADETKAMFLPESLKTSLIAPCGIDCGVCMARLREKNPCPGCRDMEKKRRAYVRKCVLRDCSGRKGDSCRACPKPYCRRLVQLDRRYRENYGTSPIANLVFMKAYGTRAFTENEKAKWTCRRCGSLLTMHRAACPQCGAVLKITVVPAPVREGGKR
jgi:hypothetical protein